VPNLIVTLGANGAIGIIDGQKYRAEGFDAGTAVDTTGAGDLFVAAYIWAEQRGAEPADRLRWGVIYAGLSVTRSTAVGGAVTEERLLSEGAQVGLAPPPAVSSRA